MASEAPDKCPACGEVEGWVMVDESKKYSGAAFLDSLT